MQALDTEWLTHIPAGKDGTRTTARSKAGHGRRNRRFALGLVMQYYGLTKVLSQAGYCETEHHQQFVKDIKGAVMQVRLIAVCGVVGSGKTVTLRLQSS